MKPILLDALHICMGGGLMILNHLVGNMVDRKVDFVLLKDSRCPKLKDEDKIKNVITLSSDNKSRKSFYVNRRNDFSSVLCFGNLPPQIKMPVPVHTYLHNVSLLKIPSDYSFKKKLLSKAKKQYIKYFAKNTDTWIVQTSNTANLVRNNLALQNQHILEYPFYHIPADICRTPKELRTDYCFIGDHTKAKGHEYLVDAWVKLSQLDITPRLHLTVSNPQFIEKINEANNQGANIINHGFVSFNEVVKIYNLSKAIVYPSLNESLGLGIIEALEAGCDVIGTNLPYMHSVCEPSVLFESQNADSIVEAVKKYEHETMPPSCLKIKDKVNSFITFLEANRKSE